MPQNDQFLTSREVAGYLGVSVTTAQIWMEDGTLASLKTAGGGRCCRRMDVENLLSGGAPLAGSLVGTAEFLPPSEVPYPVLKTERERLHSLAECRLVDSPRDPTFDRVTWLASEITGCPIALVSLLTASRQWFKSRVGLDITETPRSAAFCSHAILHEDGMIVEDALSDIRFADNPLVLGKPYIRFYAGIPVTDRSGHRLGTLCVLDSVPRQLSPNELKALKELAALVSEEISRRG